MLTALMHNMHCGRTLQQLIGSRRTGCSVTIVRSRRARMIYCCPLDPFYIRTTTNLSGISQKCACVFVSVQTAGHPSGCSCRCVCEHMCLCFGMCAAGGDGGLCFCACVCARREKRSVTLEHLFVSPSSAALEEKRSHRVQGTVFDKNQYT